MEVFETIGPRIRERGKARYEERLRTAHVCFKCQIRIVLHKLPKKTREISP
jgi:phage-related protein